MVVFCTISSIAAITNATIYRYVMAARLVGSTRGILYRKWSLAIIMFIFQFAWPFIGCVVCLKMELRSERAIRENSMVNAYCFITYRLVQFKIDEVAIQRSQQYACFIAPRDFGSALQILKPVGVIIANAFVCSVLSILLTLLCWRKITEAQKGSVSKKTIQMEQQLMISLAIQVRDFNISLMKHNRRPSFQTSTSLLSLVF